MQTVIKELLKSKGMTQTALAEATEVSRGHMSEIISGKGEPSLTLLRSIAEALDVEVSALFAKPSSGFSEGALTPLDLTGSNSTAGLANAIAPEIRTPEFYRINRDMVPLGLLAGDVLIVDKSASAKDGDMVVVVAYDAETDTSEIELRRLATPWLVGDTTYPEPIVARDSDDQTRAIHGVVRGSARGPGLSETAA